MAVTPRPPGAAEGGAERPLAPTSQMIQTSGDGTAQGLPGEGRGSLSGPPSNQDLEGVVVSEV